MVPLEDIPPPLFPYSETSSSEPQMDQGSVRHCWTVPGLARRDKGVSFPLRQLSPSQHHAMMHSMQPTHGAMNSKTGHGQATSEQT